MRGGKGFIAGVSEYRYEPIWTRDIMQSPILCLAYCGETNQLVAGHNDGEIQVRACVCVCVCVHSCERVHSCVCVCAHVRACLWLCY